jgi:hypothetical protein
MFRRCLFAAAMLSLAACGDRAAEYQTAVDTLSRRQKDSLLSTMPVPGASAVGRAMGAVDDANARSLTHDSIG